MKREKFTDRPRDDKQQMIRKLHLSFKHRWPKKQNLCKLSENLIDLSNI